MALSTFNRSASLEHCPGFIIPSLNKMFSVYNQYGPRVTIDYHPFSNRIITKLCDHKKCQPEVEFEFAMIKLFQHGRITLQQWKQFRPQNAPISSGQKLCYGETVGPLNSGAVYDMSIEPCSHRKDNIDDDCMATSPAIVAIYKLTMNKVIGRDILEEIFDKGWRLKALRCKEEGRLYSEALFEESEMVEMYLWRPRESEDWDALQMAEEQRVLSLATGEEREKLLDFSRLKCYYKKSGDGNMVVLRKRKGYITFDMKDSPALIDRLTKLWTMTGGSLKDLAVSSGQMTSREAASATNNEANSFDDDDDYDDNVSSPSSNPKKAKMAE